MDDFNFDLIHVVSPSFPKKNFLALFSIPIIYTFIIVVFDAHWGDPFTKMEKGILFLISYILIFMFGPGKFSLDNLISKRYK